MASSGSRLPGGFGVQVRGGREHGLQQLVSRLEGFDKDRGGQRGSGLPQRITRLPGGVRTYYKPTQSARGVVLTWGLGLAGVKPQP